MSKSNATKGNGKGKSTGRPKKPADIKRSHGISVWVDGATKDRISRAAALTGDGAGRWLGKVGDAAALRALEAAGLLGVRVAS